MKQYKKTKYKHTKYSQYKSTYYQSPTQLSKRPHITKTIYNNYSARYTPNEVVAILLRTLSMRSP